MSQSKRTTVTPFGFRSDFSAPEDAQQETRISISVAELAALLEDTRQSTAALIRNEQVEQQAEAIRSTTQQLKAALAQIIDLAETLERIDLSEADRQDINTQVSRIASEMIDGQGNLFQS
ncbi:hypothetical protein WNY37_15805 [Henriciella sp. AS95]|uniref:hypothetical protein n=1 Tax=Henriciella sp. AS95 TaxID=3135782 RepID=UPI003180250C